MDIDSNRGFILKGLSKINVILGKNGCGKSHLLKEVEIGLQGRPEFAETRYISPERGGFLNYEPSIEQDISENFRWMADTRRQNQTAKFKEQSTALFRRLEIMVLRQIEEDHVKPGYTPRTFEDVVTK